MPSEEGLTFHSGDRVIYSGPHINHAWDSTRVGTVLGSFWVEGRELIDIRWDHGVTNYDHEAENFTKVAEQ